MPAAHLVLLQYQLHGNGVRRVQLGVGPQVALDGGGLPLLPAPVQVDADHADKQGEAQRSVLRRKLGDPGGQTSFLPFALELSQPVPEPTTVIRREAGRLEIDSGHGGAPRRLVRAHGTKG